MPVWLVLALVACLVGPAQAARPESLEVRDRGASRGLLTITVMDDGSAYIAPDHLAALLKGAWAVKGDRGTLTVGTRVAEFMRGQTRATVHGQAVALDLPPRVSGREWLVSRDFLGKGLPRLAPGVSLALPTEARKPAAKTVQAAVPLEELPTAPTLVTASSRDRRARLRGGHQRREGTGAAARPGPRPLRVEEISDGLVQESARDGGDPAVLRVVLQSTPGSEAHVLQDPTGSCSTSTAQGERGAGGRARRDAAAPVMCWRRHGGHDSGAVGPTGVLEKEVVLDVTRRVAKKVEAGLGVKVVMSRDSDVFVTLRDRTNFANKQRADLFVSVHANAHPQSVSEGVETYFLSSEASDSGARQVAAIENGVVQLEGPGSRQRGDVLKSILWDLAQSEFQEESSFMAETVLDSMSKSLNLVNRGVKQAGFYVLGGAAMPAILIEIGFLTNRKEERKLATPEHREALARAIYAGLAEYKRRYDQRLRTAQSQPAKGGPTR